MAETSQRKIYEYLLKINSIQDVVKKKSTDDNGFKLLSTTIGAEKQVEVLTNIFPIVNSLIVTNIESFLSRSINLTTSNGSTLDSTQMKSCSAILSTHKALMGQCQSVIQTEISNTNIRLISPKGRELLKLISSQIAMFGRIVFCCTILLEYTKTSAQNAHSSGVDRRNTLVDNLHSVVIHEYISLLLDSLYNSFYVWSSEWYQLLTLDTISDSNTPIHHNLDRLLLPNSLSGPHLAQIIDLLLHFSSKLMPVASVDVRRISTKCIDLLNQLIDIIQYCPSSALSGLTNVPPASASASMDSVLTPAGDPVAVWRTYFPGIYSSLQSICMDKTQQRGSMLQTLAMVCILNLATVIMSDDLNKCALRAFLTESQSENAKSMKLSDEQQYHFDLLRSRIEPAVVNSVAHRDPTNLKQVKNKESLDLPELTRQTLPWRTDLLQRLSGHFPSVFRHTYSTVNAKHKAVLMRHMCIFINSCKEFLGQNGLSFVLPLILLGFTDTTTVQIQSESVSNNAVQSDKEGAVSSVLSSHVLMLFDTVLHEQNSSPMHGHTKIRLAATEDDDLVSIEPLSSHASSMNTSHSKSSSIHSRVIWDQYLKNILQQTLMTNIEQMVQKIVNSPTSLSGGGVSTIASSGASELKMTMSSILGCLYLLRRDAVRSLFTYASGNIAHPDSIDQPVSRTDSIGKKWIYMLISLLSPIGNLTNNHMHVKSSGNRGALAGRITVLEERSYCAIRECTVNNTASQSTSTPTYTVHYDSITVGYARLSWEYIDDAELKALIRRCCFVFGKFNLMQQLLACIAPMEKHLHKMWSRLGRVTNKTEHRDDGLKDKNNSKHRKHKNNGDNNVVASIDRNSTTPVITTADESKHEEQEALSVRLQSWSQSISVWKLLSYAVVGLSGSGYDQLQPESSQACVCVHVNHARSSKPSDVASTLTSPQRKKNQCAVCLRYESRPAGNSSTGETIPLSRCTRCKTVFYCCKEHQMSDWPHHKLVCSTVASKSASPTPPVSNDTTQSPASGKVNVVHGEYYLEHQLIDSEQVLVSPMIVGTIAAQLKQSNTASTVTPIPFASPFVAISSDKSNASSSVKQLRNIVGTVVDACVGELKRYLEYSSAHATLDTTVSSSLVIQSKAVNSSNASRLLPTTSSTGPVAMSPLEMTLMNVRMSHILDCLANCAFLLHLHGEFKSLLMMTLYTLVEMSVDTNIMVKQATESTLRRISLYCGYQSIQQLYRENLDYIIDPLCDSLRRNQNSAKESSRSGEGKSNGSVHGPVFTNSRIAMQLNVLSLTDSSPSLNNKRSSKVGVFNYSSFRAPAVVDMVFGYFGTEAYATNQIADSPRSLLDECVPLVLCRDMVENVMQHLDLCASTQMIHSGHVHTLLHVLHIIACRAVSSDSVGGGLMEDEVALNIRRSGNKRINMHHDSSTITSASVSSQSSLTLSSRLSTASQRTLLAIVSSLSDYLSMLDRLELPGATGRDPDRLLRQNHSEPIDIAAVNHDDNGSNNETEPQADQEEENVDDLKKKFPGLKLLLDVLTRCSYFVASPHLDAQMTVVSIMQECIVRLSTCTRLFLPAVHQIWSPVMSRIKEQYLVLQYYYNYLGPLAVIVPRSHPVSGLGHVRVSKSSSLVHLTPTVTHPTLLTEIYSSPTATNTQSLSLSPVKVTDSSLLSISPVVDRSTAVARESSVTAQMNQQDAHYLTNPLFLKSRLHLLPSLLHLITTINTLTTDFVASKMQDDFIPMYLDILKYMSRESIRRLENYTASQSYSTDNTDAPAGSTAMSTIENTLKLSLVAFLQKGLDTVGCQMYMMKLIPCCSVLLLPFLSSHESDELQCHTTAVYHTMLKYNPSFVGTVMDAVVTESASMLSTVSEPLCSTNGKVRWTGVWSDSRVHSVCNGLFVKAVNTVRRNELLNITNSYSQQHSARLIVDVTGTTELKTNNFKPFKLGQFGQVSNVDRMTEAQSNNMYLLLKYLAQNTVLVGHLQTAKKCANSRPFQSMDLNSSPGEIVELPSIDALWARTLERNTHM